MQKKILEAVSRARHVLYYRKLWGSINSLSSLWFEQLPLSGREIFDPEKISESLAVPEHRITYYYFSAGTTGSPKMIPFTKREWIMRSLYRKRCYEIAGVRKGDRVAILLPFGPWIAGPSAQSALLALGCTVFPMGLLSETEEILGWFSIFRRHAIDTIVTTPSFAQRLAYFHDKRSRKLSFKKIMTSGEYIGKGLREKLHASFGAAVYSSYASSESFIGIECSRHQGFHYDPDRIKVEILDQETPGRTADVGIVTITPFDAEAVPLIRYPLGDLASLERKKCSCGSSLPRIIWKGRVQEIFEVAGGVKIHGYQIRDALSRNQTRILRCIIHVSNNLMGKTSLIFHVWSSDKGHEKKKVEDNLRDTLTNMSMDVSDVVYHGLVKLAIVLHHERKPNNGMKIKIKICDERTHA